MSCTKPVKPPRRPSTVPTLGLIFCLVLIFAGPGNFCFGIWLVWMTLCGPRDVWMAGIRNRAVICFTGALVIWLFAKWMRDARQERVDQRLVATLGERPGEKT